VVVLASQGGASGTSNLVPVKRPSPRALSLLLLAAALGPVLALAPGAPAAPKATGLEGIPHFDHVVVLTEENENASETFAPNSLAPYLRSLRSKGVFLPNYYGTGHASLDNYITMVSGQPPLPHSMGDCLGLSLWECVQPQGLISGGRNLADQLEEKGLSWRAYPDGAPTACFHAPYSPTEPAPDTYQGNSTTGAKDYADRHNPFIYFPNVVGDQARCEKHQRPFSDLAKDLARGTLPAYSFITPDTCHDGHDAPCANGKPGGLVSMDLWLRQQVPPLMKYLAKHNGLLIITFDEGFIPSDPADVLGNPMDYGCQSCVLRGLGGRIGAVLISPRLPQGKTVATEYDHLNLLRSIEDSFGISEHLNLAEQAEPMTDVFAGTRRR
jgi:phospholipase C